MFNRRSMKSVLPCVLLLLSVLSVLCAQPSSGADATARVAILPFNMHTPSGLAYLQQGIRDMLASRLGWQGKVQVLEKSATEQAMKGIKGDVSAEDALRIGKALKVDYVLYGSVTGIGQSVSIDAKIAAVSGTAEPVSFFAQTKTLDDVIPQIDQCAQNINAKVFNRPSEGGRTAAAESDAASVRNPELLIPDAMIQSEKSSYLNPNIVEMTPEGSLRQPGIWKSQTIVGAILGMDVGDVDGDGRPEVVVMTKDKVTVYRKEGQGLKTIATYNGTMVDNFIWISVADVAHDGTAKIFVNNLKRKNAARGASAENVLGDRGYTEGLLSHVLALRNGKLEEVAKVENYYLNAVEFPKKGKLLVGQQKGEETVGAFIGGVYEMALRGNAVVPTVPIPLPDRCNLFNCVRADLNGDHSEETILIDKSNRLLILNPAGDMIWSSDKIFAATTNSFEGKLNDRRYNDIDYYAIPSPVMVTDLNKDGIAEVIVNRNPNALAKFLPENMKSYDKGEIVSLSWDNLGMVENWKTREITGMVTSIRLVDLDNKGMDQLVLSMVAAKDLLKLGDAKSSIISYELKPHDKKANDKKE